jgi:hypothetical protein
MRKPEALSPTADDPAVGPVAIAAAKRKEQKLLQELK